MELFYQTILETDDFENISSQFWTVWVYLKQLWKRYVLKIAYRREIKRQVSRYLNYPMWAIFRETFYIPGFRFWVCYVLLLFLAFGQLGFEFCFPWRFIVVQGNHCLSCCQNADISLPSKNAQVFWINHAIQRKGKQSNRKSFWKMYLMKTISNNNFFSQTVLLFLFSESLSPKTYCECNWMRRHKRFLLFGDFED